MKAFETASWYGGRIRDSVDKALFKIRPRNEQHVTSIMQNLFPIDQN